MMATLHRTFPAATYGPHGAIGQTLRASRWVTSCSAATLAETRRHVPEIAATSSVVLNALPLPHVAREPLPLDPPVVLCVGVADPRKGFDVALSAFADVRARHPGLRMVVAGDGPALGGELRGQAEALGISPCVRFLGGVPPERVPRLMLDATLIVMPSRAEPFGLVALQAAQVGRPIVATRVGGLPEVVVDGETGRLVAPDDAAGLAKAIAELLDEPDRMRRMGEAAWQHARQAFHWDRFVDAYEALLHRALEGGVP
jgi:glycogen(starch) synthase